MVLAEVKHINTWHHSAKILAIAPENKPLQMCGRNLRWIISGMRSSKINSVCIYFCVCISTEIGMVTCTGVHHLSPNGSLDSLQVP